MSLSELKSLVLPPEHPIDSGLGGQVSELSQRIGIELPSDLITFSACYGSGSFSSGEFWIHNPLADSYTDTIDEILDIYKDLKDVEGDDYIPFNIHPELCGLLPLGSTANGHQMFYLTEGSPAVWPILYYNRDYGTFERQMGSITNCICQIFKGQLCNLWSASTQNILRPKFEAF